ncbi:MAG: 6-bladed beta-propeller [Balneolaceae bacterium]
MIVDEINVFITPETHPDIVWPAKIRTSDDHLLLYEGRRNEFLKFNYEAEELMVIGREGRGPGEFLSVTKFWIRKDHYLLYDFNGAKLLTYDLEGQFLEEHTVDIGELTGSMHVLPSGGYVYPSKGENQALFKIKNPGTETITYAGTAVAGRDEPLGIDYLSIIRSGDIPNYMLNNIFLGSNESGIFAVQHATALVQKFNMDGELIWERSLKEVDALRGVYNEFRQEVESQDRYLPTLVYSYGNHVTDEGVAILLNTAAGFPVSIAWIPNNGDHIQIVEFPKVEKYDLPNNILGFSIAHDQNSIFFLSSSSGIVSRARWPI